MRGKDSNVQLNLNQINFFEYSSVFDLKKIFICTNLPHISSLNVATDEAFQSPFVPYAVLLPAAHLYTLHFIVTSDARSHTSDPAVNIKWCP